MAESMIENWFAENDDISQIIVGIFDYNGVLRGKRVPVRKLSALITDGLAMPLSIIQTDIWGRDIADSPLVFASGDGDAIARLSERTPLRLPWMAEPTALMIAAFCDETGQAVPACARGALSQQQARLAAQDLSIMAGVEMEFTLLADRGDIAETAPSLATGKQTLAGDTLSALHLDDYDGLFAEISALCATQDIVIDSVTSELGLGQMEITFAPKTDLVMLADDILIFKYMVKALAKSFGITASFMAKPMAGQAGNGLHIHASVITKSGQNIFHDEADHDHHKLQQAIAGILSMMADSTLVLAPNHNSYRRLVPSSHAPTKICWGWDNRSASVRIPASDAGARRLEYRSAGADANPYFLLAVLAAGIAQGLADQMQAPQEVSGNAYDQDFADLPCEMGVAMALFAQSERMKQIFGPTIHSLFLGTKGQEWERFAQHVSAFEFESFANNL